MMSTMQLRERILANPYDLAGLEKYADKIAEDKDLMNIVSNHVSYDVASLFLDAAVKSRNLSAVENLLIRGANVNNTNALNISIINNDYYIASVLLENNINEKVLENALYKAIMFSNTKIISLIINSINKVPYQALILAVENNELEVLKLIGNYVDVNNNGCLAFFSAINFLYYEAIDYFLEKGIKLNYLNMGIIAAVKRSSISICEKLLSYGADINFNKSQALIEAIKNDDLQMMNFLLDNGIQITMNAIDYALQNGIVLKK